MDGLLAEYEKSRSQLITWFGKIWIFNSKKILISFLFCCKIESVKETQRVTLDEIPLPDLPSGSSTGDFSGSASGYSDAPRSILKHKE